MYIPKKTLTSKDFLLLDQKKRGCNESCNNFSRIKALMQCLYMWRKCVYKHYYKYSLAFLTALLSGQAKWINPILVLTRFLIIILKQLAIGSCKTQCRSFFQQFQLNCLVIKFFLILGVFWPFVFFFSKGRKLSLNTRKTFPWQQLYNTLLFCLFSNWIHWLLCDKQIWHWMSSPCIC